MNNNSRKATNLSEGRGLELPSAPLHPRVITMSHVPTHATMVPKK